MPRPTARARSRRQSSRGPESRLERMANATTNVIEDAAALLDEELAAGIVAAKRVQGRFAKEGRLSATDLRDALSKIQGDVHDVVRVLGRRSETMPSRSMRAVANRFTARTHDLLDVFVDFIGSGAEVIDRMSQSNGGGRNRARTASAPQGKARRRAKRRAR